MNEQHLLVDYENVQPAIEDLLKLAPKLTDVWLFHGPNQIKRAEQLKAVHERVTLVPHSGKGKNALDFHLSFYLGYVAARHPEANLLVVANDKGYDSMIGHAKLLGFTAARVGFKAKKAPAVNKSTPAKQPPAAKTAVKKPAPAAKTAPAKKATPTKAPAPAKKAATRQPAAKQASAKQAPAKKAPAKKAPAKKAPAKKVPAKKAALPQAQARVAPASESKEFTRVKNGLSKMGDKAPHKLKSFLRHVGAQLGKGSTAEQIHAMVQQLEKAGLVHIAGDLVLYGKA